MNFKTYMIYCYVTGTENIFGTNLNRIPWVLCGYSLADSYFGLNLGKIDWWSHLCEWQRPTCNLFLCFLMIILYHIPARIEDANWTLRKVVKTGTVNTVLKTQHSSDVKLANGSETSGTHSQAEQAVPDSGDSPPQEARDLFNVVSFLKGNFVQAWHPPENTRYHLISW